MTLIGAGIGLDSSSLLVGPGLDGPTPARVPEADPTREYAEALGPGAVVPLLGLGEYDGYFCRHPLATYRRMLLTPAVGSSLAVRKAAALAGGIHLSPAVKPSDSPGDTPDEALAEEIADFCRRAQSRMEKCTPIIPLLWEMMDALAECHKLAEIVMEPVAAGPDAGRLSLKAVKTKPRWAYRFRVDGAMNVTAIEVWTLEGKWEPVEPCHFAVLAWDKKDGDPRGTSALDGIHHAWNMLIQLWNEFYNGNKQFGTPSLFGTTGPNEQGVPRTDANGDVIPGKMPISAQQHFAAKAVGFRNGKVLIGKNGATLGVVESQRDGVGMNNAISVLEGQIIRGILLQERATTEAKHGSRADSQTGQDILGTLGKFDRAWVAAMWRGVLRELVEVNFGDDAAARLTPEVTLGTIETQDFVAFATAIAVLYQAGYFTEGQLPSTDVLLGLSQRRPGDARVGPQKDNTGAAPADPSPMDVQQAATVVLEAMTRKGADS